MSKGSWVRPTNHAKYSDEWERIFGQPKHGSGAVTDRPGVGEGHDSPARDARKAYRGSRVKRLPRR